MFHCGHLDLSKIQAGYLFDRRTGLALIMVMIGRWSLPVYGPCEVVELRANWDDAKMRSMVDSLPEAGSILVPMFNGVRIAASGCSRMAEWMDLPAVFTVEFDSQREWWALKSPAIMKGLGLLNKMLIYSGGQSPLGQ